MFRRKMPPAKTFDREKLEPVIRCSICTGEEVAGFRNLQTGKFQEERLLRGKQDLGEFMAEYSLSAVPRRIY